MPFLNGQTIRIKCTFRASGSLTNPGTPVTIDIEQPDGTLDVDGATCTQLSTGIYYYDYTSSVAGKHWYKFTTNDNDMKEGDFKVIDGNI